MAELSDWEIVQKYVEQCRDFINPLLFKDVRERGLIHIVDRLPKDVDVALSVATARMIKYGKMSEDVRVNEHVESILKRVDVLKKELNDTPSTEKHVILEKIQKIKELLERL